MREVALAIKDNWSENGLSPPIAETCDIPRVLTESRGQSLVCAFMWISNEANLEWRNFN